MAQDATILSLRRRSAVLQPSGPKKFQGRPDIGGLASLGWMGKQGVAVEPGCCRNTGRVPGPVMEKSEYESANEAQVIQAQGRPFGPQNLNQMKHRMLYRMRYRIRYDADNLRYVAQNIQYHMYV
jgi:hypothetical protein